MHFDVALEAASACLAAELALAELGDGVASEGVVQAEEVFLWEESVMDDAV